MRGDRLSPVKVTGLLLGMAGIGVLVGAPDTSDRPEVLTASILLALMPMTWAVGTILQARVLRHGSPLPLVAIGACAGSLFLLPFAAAQAGDAGDWTLDVALRSATWSCSARARGSCSYGSRAGCDPRR